MADAVQLYDEGVYVVDGSEVVPASEASAWSARCGRALDQQVAACGTIAHGILTAHNEAGGADAEQAAVPAALRLRFDALASHDITYVGVIQTAKASGLTRFPVPYVLTNCHNTLCAVGGTINEDDHVFGLSAAKRYGGIFVPPHIAVIHQYMREMQAGCGRMILGTDSHTRYGALGTMAIGEGGGELVKQLLGDTYDIAYPRVVAVYLEGAPAPGVGPQDIALAIIGAVFASGYVKNAVMEFVGPGVSSMPVDYRNSVDVMTTETTCLSSIWRTDAQVQAYLAEHGRPEAYRALEPAAQAYYDGCVRVDLGAVRPMIALPFHPSNVYAIEDLNEDLTDILHEVEGRSRELAGGRAGLTLTDKILPDGRLQVQQGVIAGCSGGNFTNVMQAARALRGKSCGNGEFALSVYPSSQPVFLELASNGAAFDLMQAGAIVRTAFCGPCFGAGDTPANNGLSVRHTTRNFPSREGSKPGSGQLAGVALMDARSVAATAAAGGILTPATDLPDTTWDEQVAYHFDAGAYERRVYNGFGAADGGHELVYGPNIKDWPAMEPLSEHILLKVASKIMDEVTTTDELIPSGETSSYRSNPLGLAEFTLSRRDPAYVGRAKDTAALERERLSATAAPAATAAVFDALERAGALAGATPAQVEIGSVLYAVKPGDGSAREQAASCQRVLGGLANIVREYATKRYRSNVMNWGMVPFQLADEPAFEVDDYVYVPGIRTALASMEDGEGCTVPAFAVRMDEAGAQVQAVEPIELALAPMTAEERAIVMAGCLINRNRERAAGGCAAADAER